jgi:hypothetical protein
MTQGFCVFENDPTYPISGGQNVNAGWWTNTINFTLAQTRIKTYICPSDSSLQRPVNGVFIATYANNLTFTGGYYGNPTGLVLGKTSYLASAGCIGPATNSAFYNKYNGAFYNRSKEALGQISSGDGTSNTALFGESFMGGEPTRDFSVSWMGGGYMVHAWGMGYIPGNAVGTTAYWYQFSGKHPQVVNFALADGSVRPVRKGVGTTFFTADWYAFNRLGGAYDGETIDFGVLGN